MVTLDASDEAMGLVAWTGAALMMGASLLASVGDQSAAAVADDGCEVNYEE